MRHADLRSPKCAPRARLFRPIQKGDREKSYQEIFWYVTKSAGSGHFAHTNRLVHWCVSELYQPKQTCLVRYCLPEQFGRALDNISRCRFRNNLEKFVFSVVGPALGTTRTRKASQNLRRHAQVPRKSSAHKTRTAMCVRSTTHIPGDAAPWVPSRERGS